ncbi:hypothetical protein SAMN05216299_12616 [Nitrosospira sp. Nsp14]|uniref:hypothetical protein n=1 Tax=Nitrosospira sp. Nsp14 TaxID=1855333 RepID=UPI0008E8C4CE|nr:hypothetical protein [Nitrosospira sp. Nsp14]SFH58313.1 hypothetical protein SAMN05216299_12616 [Nitrosospira sp. Nsp14]
MAYNQKEWLAKMDKATTGEEIGALIMELPIRGPAIPEDGPEFSTMEQQTTSRPSTSTTRTAKTQAG